MIAKKKGGRPVLLACLLLLLGGSALAQRSNDANQQAAFDLENARELDRQRIPDPQAPSPLTTIPAVTCWNGERVTTANPCPPLPPELEQPEFCAGAMRPRSVCISLLFRPADPIPIALGNFDPAAAAAAAAEAEAQYQRRQQEALREEEYRRRFRTDRSVDLVGGNRRDQLAQAAWSQDRARLAVANCQPRNDESALADAVRKARLDAISSPSRRTLGDLAYALSNAKQYDAAILEFERALAAKNEYRQRNTNLFLGRAQALANLGRLKQAFADLDRAGVPEEIALLREQLQGRAAVAKGDPAAAIRHFEKAIELKPSEDSDLKLELAETYWHAGRRTDAIAKVDEAINQVSTEQTADVSAGRVSLFIAAWDERVKRFCPPQ